MKLAQMTTGNKRENHDTRLVAGSIQCKYRILYHTLQLEDKRLQQYSQCLFEGNVFLQPQKASHANIGLSAERLLLSRLDLCLS